MPFPYLKIHVNKDRPEAEEEESVNLLSFVYKVRDDEIEAFFVFFFFFKIFSAAKSSHNTYRTGGRPSDMLKGHAKEGKKTAILPIRVFSDSRGLSSSFLFAFLTDTAKRRKISVSKR